MPQSIRQVFKSIANQFVRLSFSASVHPKDNVGRLSASAVVAEDSESRLSVASNKLNDDFVFVTPRLHQTKVPAAFFVTPGTSSVGPESELSELASGESFISCDTASVSTVEGVSAQNKRKRVRKRKKKNVVVENTEETSEAAFEPPTIARPNPFKGKPNAAKSNKHVRYV